VSCFFGLLKYGFLIDLEKSYVFFMVEIPNIGGALGDPPFALKSYELCRLALGKSE
jgi:hypothetical protein